jgi:hypothetical protein
LDFLPNGVTHIHVGMGSCIVAELEVVATGLSAAVNAAGTGAPNLAGHFKRSYLTKQDCQVRRSARVFIWIRHSSVSGQFIFPSNLELRKES